MPMIPEPGRSGVRVKEGSEPVFGGPSVYLQDSESLACVP